MRVSALQTDLRELLRDAERHGATLVGRAGLGLSWLRLDEGDPERARSSELRGALPGRRARPAGRASARAAREPPTPAPRVLARRVKERFDPTGTLV